LNIVRTMTRGVLPWKLSFQISTAECLYKLMGLESVQKIETGLECCQLLLKKLLITVAGAIVLCELNLFNYSTTTDTIDSSVSILLTDRTPSLNAHLGCQYSYALFRGKSGQPDLDQDLLCEPSVVKILRTDSTNEYSSFMNTPP
jgi:hypothetical protein